LALIDDTFGRIGAAAAVKIPFWVPCHARLMATGLTAAEQKALF
jgi:hypothetical protein